MSLDSQISALNGAMDMDAHPKYINTDAGHVGMRVNLRAGGSRGKKFVNTKLKGTRLIESDLPVGENKCIGWCNDAKNDAVVYFIHNSNNNHSVYRYFTTTKVSQKLWYAEPELGLVDDVLRAVVVEGRVYWTNGKGTGLKAFNLDYAAQNKYTSDDRPFAENVFTLIRKPPQFAPKVKYDSDVDYNFNNLRKKLFQFKYAFVYEDEQVSAWSAISKVPLPNNELGLNGEFTDDITKNNCISILFNTGGKLVKQIIMASRDTSPRNTGSFFLFDKIDKYDGEGNQIIPDDSTEEIVFYNNKKTENIDTDINNRYCDFVPLSAKDIVLLDGKYLGIAYPEEGYDKVDVNYELEEIKEDIAVEDEVQVLARMTGETALLKRADCSGFLKMHWIDIPKQFYPNAYYNISFTIFNGVNVSFTVPTGSTNPNYPRAVRDALVLQMQNYFSTNYPEIYSYVEPKSSTSPRGIALGFTTLTGACPPMSLKDVKNLRGSVTTSLANVMPEANKSLKRGQYHPFGLIYNDGYGRYNIVHGEQELYVSLPENDTFEELRKRTLCQWKIHHKPPVWAKTFRWAYVRNKSYTYARYFAYVKSTKGTGKVEDGGNGIPVDKFFLEINQAQENVREYAPNYIISDYVWHNGDRVRVVGDEKSYEVLTEHQWINDNLPSAGKVGFLVDKDLVSHSLDIYNNLVGYIKLAEIYRPNPSPVDNIFYEIGEEYEILDAGTPNRRHKGELTDQNASLTIPAIGTMDFGDVYLRQRVAVDENNELKLPIVEDEYFNDYYMSDSIDIGRIAAKIESKKKFLNRVIRGENYIEDTNYNRLNVFLAGTEYFHASIENGEITGIENVGDVLKVIQPHKETSVYIGKNAVKQADGSNIVLSTDKIFGSVNPYIEFRGTTYRRSMVSNRRYLYYFDESTGEFIRSSANGQLAISSYYRMRSWFERKARELREYSGEKDIIVGINNDNDEVYITFITGNKWETLVFLEEEENKGWAYFCTLVDETGKGHDNFLWYGDIMLSTHNGRLFEHDSEADLNTFYGKHHSSRLDFYVNKAASIEKRFSNIRMSTNKNIWDIEMAIPEGLNYGNQKTVLKPTILREREGQIVSDILRNIISENGNENVSLLRRGSRMTGEYMKISLTEQSVEDAELREIEVSYIMST